jgi:NCAIR mutase (PurE)-related protein
MMRQIRLVARVSRVASNKQVNRNLLSTTKLPTPLIDVLRNVYDKKIEPREAEELIASVLPTNEDNTAQNSDELLRNFANLDHERSSRTGFPEAVFAEGKTPDQVAKILDDMARHANESSVGQDGQNQPMIPILATRVASEMYNELSGIPLHFGTIEYHEKARIVSMTASCWTNLPKKPQTVARRRIIVATAGTTDIFVAEEAAVTLEAAGCEVGCIALSELFRGCATQMSRLLSSVQAWMAHCQVLLEASWTFQ